MQLCRRLDNTNNNTTTLISTPSTITARSVVVLTSPSVAAIQHYPPDHPNSKYPLLNSLNYNLMDRFTQSASIRSSSQMDGLVREIKEFKRDNNEEFVIKSMNSRIKKIVEVPCVSASSFYKKGKEWLDDLLQSCTTSNDTSVGVKCMIEYFLKRLKKHFKKMQECKK
jgi:hypothetical protein